MEVFTVSLDDKTKELVAIGAAIGSNCIPCLKWHYKRCIELEIPIKEIQEAIDMAKRVKEAPIKEIYEVAQKLIKN